MARSLEKAKVKLDLLTDLDISLMVKYALVECRIWLEYALLFINIGKLRANK